jgi:Putative zinc-finger
MSCENVQELISPLLDGKLPEAGREDVLAHTGVCRECGTRLESLQTQRAILRKMAQTSVPDALAAKLSVMASYERHRQLARVDIWERMRRIAASVSLVFDNLMRPVALPVTGGLLSAVLLFGLMIPKLSFSYTTTGREFSTVPIGRVVTNPYDQVVDADEDFPRIEPISASPSDFLNVVDLTIDESGKIVDWTVVRGDITPDMKSVILFSNFEPATNMGVPTSGKIRIVQFAPSATVRG